MKKVWVAATAVALFFGGGPAHGQARQQATVIMSPDKREAAGQDELGYASAVVAGDMVYLSGVIAFKAKPDETMDASYERAFRQMGGTLTQAGVNWDDVVDMTSYHTDVTAQMEAMVAVHRRYVTAPFPAWTAIDVDRLIPERGITEIKIVARRPAARAGG